MTIQGADQGPSLSPSLLQDSPNSSTKRRQLNRSVSAPRLRTGDIQPAVTETDTLISAFSSINLAERIADPVTLPKIGPRIAKSTPAFQIQNVSIMRADAEHKRMRADFQDYNMDILRSRRDSYSSGSSGSSDIDRKRSFFRSGSSQESGSAIGSPRRTLSRQRSHIRSGPMEDPVVQFGSEEIKVCEFKLYTTFIKNMNAVLVALPTHIKETDHGTNDVLNELSQILKNDSSSEISAEIIEKIKNRIFLEATRQEAPIFLKKGGMILEPVLRRLEKVRTCLFGIMIRTEIRTEPLGVLFTCLDSLIKLEAVNDAKTKMTAGKDLSKFFDKVARIKKRQKGCWEFIKYGFGDHDEVRDKVIKQLQAYQFG